MEAGRSEGLNMIFHNSQDIRYREPFGAVTSGTRVSLYLYIREEQIPEKCFLRLWDGKTEEIIQMFDVDNSGFYKCSFEAENNPTPLWYYFIIDYPDETIFYGNNEKSLGGPGSVYKDQPPSYQITVYKKQFKTPSWFPKGPVYHIFVDRFSRSDKYSNTQKYKRYHEDWYEQPCHLPSDGEEKYFPDDFFGGNLQGIIDKLGYIHGLGATSIYLSPIFESRSNHKYDTADYSMIDSSFGNEEIFKNLCKEAASLGIRIILDGVFSHTGDDSIYFNKYKNYSSLGAYNSMESEYYPWYTFEEYPDTYKCWWDVVSMPTIDKECVSFRDYICSSDGIASKWLKAGASGWRLDVADELPMDFLKLLRKTVKDAKGDSLLMGEVWEDASNKVSYGNLRNYCYGDTLDSVMNYPIREALIDFILGRIDSIEAISILNSQLENYPAEFLHENMNLLGSHDRARLRTILSGAPPADSMTRNEQAYYVPDEAEAQYASARTMALASMMFIMPGVPHIYYGDEAGLEGMADPFNRKCYPWGREDMQLLEFFKRISSFRKDNEVLISGDTEYFQSEFSIGCRRTYGSHEVFAIFNRDTGKSDTISFNAFPDKTLIDLFTGKAIGLKSLEKMSICLKPLQFKVFYT